MEVVVTIKQTRSGAAIPAYATAGSAAVDLRACLSEDLLLPPGARAGVPTGLAIALPSSDYAALLFARSGLALKHGLALANGVGVVDADYRGEIVVALVNHGDAPYLIRNGDRIAQLAVLPVCRIRFVLADNLPDSARGSGGFGSTGVGAGDC